MKKILNNIISVKYISIYSSLLAILAGLLVGLIALIITNPGQAFPAFTALLLSGFSQGSISIGNVIYYSAPIILTGLSVGFAFKTGLFNIGATGQLLVGSFVAIFIGINWVQLGPFQWIAGLIFAGLAGGIWALIPGLLKAFRGVHEVVTSIMMNYIAMYFVNFFVKNSIYHKLKNESLPVDPNSWIPKMGLDKVFPHSNIQGGIVIAVVAVLVIYYILHKTVLGFELKSVGLNSFASKYAGINEKKSIIISMAIAGALSGLAGAIIYMTGSGRYLKVVDTMPSEGFMGISVALLGLSEPVGVFLSGIFFGYLKVGGQDMQLYDFAPEVIDVITSLIIYFSALSLVFQTWAIKLFRLKGEEE